MKRKSFLVLAIILPVLAFAASFNMPWVPNQQKGPTGGGGGGGGTVIEFDAASNGKIDGFSVASGGTTWSVSFWIKPITSLESFGPIIGDLPGLTGEIAIQGDERINVYYSSTNHLIGSAGNVPVDTWSQVVVSVNAGSATVYVNGSSVGTTSSVPAFTLNAMGSDPYGQDLNARLSDLAFYSIALSGTNAANLYAKTTTPTTIGSLLAYWQLNDVANGASGNGATFVDSASSNNGTGSGGLTGRTLDY